MRLGDARGVSKYNGMMHAKANKIDVGRNKIYICKVILYTD